MNQVTSAYMAKKRLQSWQRTQYQHFNKTVTEYLYEVCLRDFIFFCLVIPKGKETQYGNEFFSFIAFFT